MTDYNKRQAKIIQDRLKTDQELAQERQYVSERTVPAEGEILGPSDSVSKEEEK